jgi:hypothetical protein
MKPFFFCSLVLTLGLFFSPSKSRADIEVDHQLHLLTGMVNSSLGASVG